MSRVYDLNSLHSGEQLLATELLKVIPLIEKHFKPFDGKKARIQSGDSAGYKKVQAAFRDDCSKVSDIRIHVTDSTNSQWIKSDVKQESQNGHGWHYFDHGFYLGTVDIDQFNHEGTNNFIYDYDPEGTKRFCNDILNTSKDDLIQAKIKITELNDQIKAVKKSFPYSFTDYIQD